MTASSDPPASPAPDGRLVDCTESRHAPAVLAIFNEAILGTTALYEYEPRSPEVISRWFADRRASARPVLGIETRGEGLLGFASCGSFRAFPANKYTVEHSVYVRSDARGRGVGRCLLVALIERTRQQLLHVMVGGIDAGNRASIALHESLGFVHAGTLPEVGFKFGRWLDLSLYLKQLATPDAPVDG